MLHVSLVFRKFNPLYFSIEKVFKTLIPFFPADVKISETYVRSERANLPALFKNLFTKQRKSDVYHITGDVHYMALALPTRKTILTIHDCIFMKTVSGPKRWLMQWLWLKLPVMKSRVVTVISEATRSDVIKYSGCKAEKVKVIPDPVGAAFRYIPATFNQSCPRLLQVGTWPNKNLERVIEAIRDINCELVIIGKLQQDQLEKLEASAIRYTNVFNLSEKELVDEFEKADILVFASTFEGFGLPIIEAQTTGRVVVTSNLLPMSEVAGNAAVLVDPFRPESIRNGIQQVISNASLREELVKNGLENVKKYSAANVAAEYYQLYKAINN